MIDLVVIVAIAFLYFASPARLGDPCRTAPDAPAIASAQRESPLGCNLVALTPEQRKRHFEELGPELRRIRKSVRELPSGYEFEFSSDVKTVALLAEWAAQEHLCCPFFDIDLHMEREGGAVWLRLTGREGTKAFIQAEALEWIR